MKSSIPCHPASSSSLSSFLRHLLLLNICWFKMMLVVGNFVVASSSSTRPRLLSSLSSGSSSSMTALSSAASRQRRLATVAVRGGGGGRYGAFASVLDSTLFHGVTISTCHHRRQQQQHEPQLIRNTPSSSTVFSVRNTNSIHHRTRGKVESSILHFSSSSFFSTSSSSSSSESESSISDDPSSPSQSQQQQQQQSSSSSPPPLILDPKAPLRPLLAEKCHENHLSHYTLPPTNIGIDDYRPNLPKNTRIVAFGDVHGDITALRSFLITAKLLDPNSTNEEPMWIGGSTLCVQTGDVLDRGDDELACYRLLATLSRQAKLAGGAILLLYGNHESLNAAGLFQYANPGGNVEFEKTIGSRIDYNFGSNRWRLQFAGNEPSRWAAFEPGGLLAENMMGNMLVACVLGRTVFVHAGLTASHLTEKVKVDGRKGMRSEILEEEKDGVEKESGGISRLNEQAREWILKAHHGDNNNWGEFNSVQEVIAAAQNRARVASKTMPDCLGGGIGASSPVWMRDYSQPNDREPKNPKAKSMIEEALKESGPDVQRMVMGHTPQSKINSALDGKAWRIDVGASRGVMGGSPEVLEIIHQGGENDEDIVNILTEDGKQISGKERSVADAIIMDFFDMKR